VADEVETLLQLDWQVKMAAQVAVARIILVMVRVQATHQPQHLVKVIMAAMATKASPISVEGEGEPEQ
jgi:hypothetical protein